MIFSSTHLDADSLSSFLTPALLSKAVADPLALRLRRLTCKIYIFQPSHSDGHAISLFAVTLRCLCPILCVCVYFFFFIIIFLPEADLFFDSGPKGKSQNQSSEQRDLQSRKEIEDLIHSQFVQLHWPHCCVLL